MPWSALATPSIQVGVLTSALKRSGLDVTARSYFLEFGEMLVRETRDLPPEQRMFPTDYVTIAERLSEVAGGDWVFASALDAATERSDDDYFDCLRRNRVPEKYFTALHAARRVVPAFLRQCAADVLASAPRIVAFTSTFNQTIPSLALAKLLKEHDPGLSIVFGGANVEGPMGIALHRAFDFVDVVLQGEGELTFPALVRALLEDGDLAAVPGISYRSNGVQRVTERPATTVPVGEIPVPDYDEYFERLHRCKIRPLIEPKVHIPIESSRGCWLGQVSHCTFCGLNGTTMRYRSKEPSRFVDEIMTLSRRYQKTSFFAVDNILDMRYFESSLSELSRMRREGHDISLFFETKANLKKHHVERLRDAGVEVIQPGIESLSTPILKLMGKGVSALHNIRLLKWAREYGIEMRWNLLFGFPGEPDDEYVRMAHLLPSLVHLKPPGFAKLKLQRFSPYFDRPQAYGIRVTGPEEYYRYIYPCDADALAEIAYSFDFEYDVAPAARPKELLRQAVVAWRKTYNGDRNQLMLERGLGFIVIRDRRRGSDAQTIYTFPNTSAAIYLGCDAGATVDDLRALLCSSGTEAPSREEIEAFLRRLVEQRLMVEENGVYLSLAVAAQPLVSYAALIASMLTPAPAAFARAN
jgi:ribosomal peptide maturation radical SAM protein 1